MANFVFNIAKGAVAEKVRDAASNLGVLILRTDGLGSDATLMDQPTVAALLSVASEPTNTGYSRKTGITGTVTVDNTNDRVNVSIPNQTWTAVGAGDAWAKLVVFYEEGASDANRIPLTGHDFAVTPDGSDITAAFPATGFYQAS
jgi:hypothetical protein